ncbi:hypothetical protein [Nostoc sp.]|uniref:hypothetical protein n=1 Tax=Nostoc sp. TaxID=1180 RepID=UPI002FFCBC19
MPANQRTSAGLEYGSTVSGKMYLSKDKHRGNGSREHKSMWCILPDTEYDIFCNSDKHNMCDSNQDYWGVLEGGKAKLGEKGERISKFPCTSNETDHWHGYPVFPVEERQGARGSLPPDFDDLIAEWIKSKIIAKEFGKKILQEKK